MESEYAWLLINSSLAIDAWVGSSFVVCPPITGLLPSGSKEKGLSNQQQQGFCHGTLEMAECAASGQMWDKYDALGEGNDMQSNKSLTS